MERYRGTSNTIACTLTADELKETELAWKKLIRLSMVSRQDIAGGVRLTVDPRSEDALRQLIDIERECCPWITFEVDGPTVAMTAPGAGASAIREIWADVQAEVTHEHRA